MDAILTGSGEFRARDEALCVAIGQDLTSAFEGYAWDVGADHEAGVVCIRLAVPMVGGAAQPGFLLHISTVIGPDGRKKVHRAAGEVLERWRLRRDRAPRDWMEEARENGLITDAMILKSRH